MSQQINMMVKPRMARKAIRSSISNLQRVVFRGRQRCTACGGIGQWINNRMVFMLPTNQPYPHREGCSQKGKF